MHPPLGIVDGRLIVGESELDQLDDLIVDAQDVKPVKIHRVIPMAEWIVRSVAEKPPIAGSVPARLIIS